MESTQGEEEEIRTTGFMHPEGTVVNANGTLTVTPTEAVGTLEELKAALAEAYGGKVAHKYKMTELLNRQRAKQNKVTKRRANNKVTKTTRAKY